MIIRMMRRVLLRGRFDGGVVGQVFILFAEGSWLTNGYYMRLDYEFSYVLKIQNITNNPNNNLPVTYPHSNPKATNKPKRKMFIPLPQKWTREIQKRPSRLPPHNPPTTARDP